MHLTKFLKKTWKLETPDRQQLTIVYQLTILEYVKKTECATRGIYKF